MGKTKTGVSVVRSLKLSKKQYKGLKPLSRVTGELDENEFYDVYREFFPDASRKEFQKAWIEFQEAKREHDKAKLVC